MQAFNRRNALKASFATAVAAGTAGAFATEVKAAEAEKKITADVVIVGAGCAGLSAAIEAADKGASVVVLEKMPAPFGNTIYAGGIFNATNTSVQKEQGVEDTVEAFYEDMMKVSMYRGDATLTKVFAEESAGAIEWLRQRVGIKFKKIVKEVWPGLGRGHVVDGPKKPGGAQLVTQLLEIVKNTPSITFLPNTKVIELKSSATLECTGVKALSKKEGLLDITAKGGVIMCTGGFHANQEMVCKYMGGNVAWMPLRGSAYMMGENVELTRKFSPFYVNMDQFHGGPIHGPTQANPSTLVNYGVIVDKNAQRIIDEVNTYVYVAKRLPLITPDNWAFIVIDSDILENDTVRTRLDRYAAAKAPVYQGNTIEELAKAMEVDPKALKATIDEYNAKIKAGKGSELTPPNTLQGARLIEKGPFRALPFQGGMTATFGGPKITPKAEVINGERQPIKGLYAAGNAIGGLFYWDYIVGSQLTGAVIFGRRAADEAAARAKSQA